MGVAQLRAVIHDMATQGPAATPACPAVSAQPASPVSGPATLLKRLSLRAALYVAACFTLVAAYVTAMVLIGWSVHDVWGTGGAIATTGGCFALSGLIALAVANWLGRAPGRAPAIQPQPPAPPVDDDDSPALEITKAVAERIPPSAWVVLASTAASAVVAIGPARLARIGSLALGVILESKRGNRGK